MTVYLEEIQGGEAIQNGDEMGRQLEQGNEKSLQRRKERIQQEESEVNGGKTEEAKRKEEGTLRRFQEKDNGIGQTIRDKQQGRRMTGARRFLGT